MHELHLINDLITDLLNIAGEKNVKRITKIYLKMGEFTEINPLILKFYLQEKGVNTILQDAVIDITKSNKRELSLISFDAE